MKKIWKKLKFIFDNARIKRVALVSMLVLSVCISFSSLAPVPTAHAVELPEWLGGSLDPFEVIGAMGENAADGLKNWLLALIGNAVLGLAATALWIAGKFLDGSVYLTVHMKDILDAVPVVDVGWKVFRDLANLVFIFVLLYIAIATILNVANTRRMLVDVIITALLINFSLFITKAIVDVSNLVALQFYNKIQSYTSADDNEPFWLQKGPSAAFMEGLKIQSVYSYQSATEGNTGGIKTDLERITGKTTDLLKDGVKFLTVTFLGSVIMIIAAFIFATGAFLLFIRIAVLMFLMMISPLAFVARILPKTQDAWNKWWKALINNAIFAPVYLAFTYILVSTVAGGGLSGVTVIGTGGAESTAGAGTFAEALSGVPSSLGIVFNYVFIIILMVMSLGISKALGVHGANAVSSWASSASNWARSKTKKAGGWAVSKTAGEWARRYEERAATEPGRQSWLATRVRSFTTQPLAQAKIAGAKSAAERHKEEKGRKERLQDAQIVANVKDAGARLKNLRARGASEDEMREGEEQLQNAMTRLSSSGFSSIATGDFEKAPELARYANSAQFQGLMNSDKTQEEKDRLIRLRFKHITDMFAKRRDAEARAKARLQLDPTLYATYDEGRGLKNMGVGWTDADDKAFEPAHDEVRGKSAKELGYLNRANPDMINKIAPSLNWWQIKDMRKSDDFSFSQREGKGNALRDYKETGVADAADILFGIPLTDARGPLSIEERFKQREKASRTWQKVIEKGEHLIPTAEFSDEERAIWARLRAVPQAQRELALKLIATHQKGRSPEELMNPAGRVRNIPVLGGTYGASILKNMMGKDNIHHEVQMRYLLRNYAKGTLTENSKAFMTKVLFDRDGKDFYSNWQELAGKMNIPQAQIDGLADYVLGRNGRSRADFERLPTVSLADTLPGAPPPPPPRPAPGAAGAGGVPPAGAPGGAGAPPPGPAPTGGAAGGGRPTIHTPPTAPNPPRYRRAFGGGGTGGTPPPPAPGPTGGIPPSPVPPTPGP